VDVTSATTVGSHGNILSACVQGSMLDPVELIMER